MVGRVSQQKVIVEERCLVLRDQEAKQGNCWRGGGQGPDTQGHTSMTHTNTPEECFINLLGMS